MYDITIISPVPLATLNPGEPFISRRIIVEIVSFTTDDDASTDSETNELSALWFGDV